MWPHSIMYKFLTAHTLNSKVNNWGTEIASMSCVIFKHVKGPDNILADSVSHLRSIHLYDSLDLVREWSLWTEYVWRTCPHIHMKNHHPYTCLKIFKNHLPYTKQIHTEEIPAQTEQNDTMIHEIQHIPLKSDQEEIRGLQGKDPYYAKLIENMKKKNKRSKGDHGLDPHGTLYKKIKGHGKEFRALIVPKTIQKYMFYESHNGLGHSGTTRLFQFLNRQYYWKGLKESVQKLVRHCLQCQTTNLQMLNYVTSSRNTQTPMDFISIDVSGPFETTTKGNRYTLTVRCMLTN